MYLPILHLPRVESRCKLQEQLHRVIGPSRIKSFAIIKLKLCVSIQLNWY